MVNSPEFSWVPRKWIAIWWMLGSSLLLWCSDCCLAPPRHHSVWSVVFFILAEVPLTPSLKVLNSFILSPCCWPQCVCLSTSHKPIHLLIRKQWKLLWNRRWRWWWQQCPQHSQRSHAHRAGRCRSILAHECISAAKSYLAPEEASATTPVNCYSRSRLWCCCPDYMTVWSYTL